MELPYIMVGVMVKNASKFLPSFIEVLDSLTYPKEKLRLVFMYGKSSDNTLSILKEMRASNKYNMEVYLEPYDVNLKKYGTHAAGCILNDYKRLMLDREDYFLLLDTHIVEAPEDYIERLLQLEGDIRAPYVWNEGYTHFYDSYYFRIDGHLFSPNDPPITSYPFEVDCVGTTWLANREVFLNAPVFTNIVSFFYNARAMGYDIVVDPRIEVIHADLLKLGIVKSPPPIELGYLPTPGLVDSGFPLTPYKRRSKKHLYSSKFTGMMEQVELKALDLWIKGERDTLRACKNLVDMNTFFCTRDPYKINLMYKLEMYPRYIEVELSNICPFKCIWCERTYLKEKPRLMSWKEFMLIMKNFPDLAQISFTGIGEAWTNPIFLDCIRYVKERGVFFEQYDNFQFITKERAMKLVEYKVDRLIISLDAATKKTYESIRVGHKWDRMLEGLRYIKKAKRKLRSKLPVIGIHFVIAKPNVHEALEVLELAKQLEVDFVFYNRLLHKYPEIEHLYMEIPKHLIESIVERSRELKVPISINQPAAGNLPPLNMCVAIFQPFFLVNGDVITCCAQHEQNRRNWEKSMRMGNIFEAKDFRKIWYGKRYRQLRQLLYNNRLPEACIDCPVYQWRGHKPVRMVSLE